MLCRGRKQFFREFWALKDITLDIRAGETVGIVGRNGSGKSTLLQLICGTLNPSQGEIDVRGRIAALLELGSGFNPEFTGRENVFLYGSILGLSRGEIAQKFDEIAAFADIGEFLEQPIKLYSSGMVVRLAFAVAVSVSPQVLVIDEALAVGDELFQRKCFSRINQIKAAGATILFVSHSGGAVVELCDRAVLLDGGELIQEGEPKKIVGIYQRLLYANESQRVEIRALLKQGLSEPARASVSIPGPSEESKASLIPEDDRPSSEDFFDANLKPQSTVVYESCGAHIFHPRILNSAGQEVNCLVRGQEYRFCYEVKFAHAASAVKFGMLIKTLAGAHLGGSAIPSPKDRTRFQDAGTREKVTFAFVCSLNPGLFFLNAGVQGETDGEYRYLHRILDILAFRVLPVEHGTSTGLVDFHITPEVVPLNEDVAVMNI